MTKVIWKLDPDEKMIVYEGKQATEHTYRIKVKEAVSSITISYGGVGIDDTKREINPRTAQDVGPGYFQISIENNTASSANGFFQIVP